MIIMASDGLWDRIDNREALKIVREGALGKSSISSVDFVKKGAEVLIR